MRVLLMLVGIALSAGAYLFWVYMNGLASTWNTSGREWSIDWLSGESLLYFWLPFVAGLTIILLGWRWKRR